MCDGAAREGRPVRSMAQRPTRRRLRSHRQGGVIPAIGFWTVLPIVDLEHDDPAGFPPVQRLPLFSDNLCSLFAAW
jgi:hypothetical protein